MEKGRWLGPIPSSFGQHFVYISERLPGGVPPLDAVREAVLREWSNARRLEAEQKLYGSLRDATKSSSRRSRKNPRNLPPANEAFACLLILLGVLVAQPARSDELRPGYLELRQTAPNTYDVLFEISARGEDLRLAVYLKLPEGTQDVGAPRGSFGEGAFVERRKIRRDGGLAGQPVSI